MIPVRACAAVSCSIALATCSLYRDGDFACTEHEQCGSGGRCSAGFCSFRDEGCDSGFRYGQYAGELSNECAPACSRPGELVVPIAAANATPSVETNGDACYIDSVLALDGMLTGLDRSFSNACPVLLGSRSACGCVAVDLGGVTSLRAIRLWAAASTDACGIEPCTECGSGRTANLFAGSALGTYHFADTITIGTSVTEIRVAATVSARYLVVCRADWSTLRDDVVVDYLAGECQ